MSIILSRIYNSAPTDDSHLLLTQFDCTAWDEPIRLAVSSADETVTLPGGSVATFEWSGLAVELPDKTSSGGQDLALSIGGATLDVLEKIDQALDADSVVTVTLYVYTEKHRIAPQKKPLTLQVVSVVSDDLSVQCAARARDIVNASFPALRYTTNIAPGLKYFG